MDLYVSLEEAAKLEGVSYSTMKVRKHRNPEAYKIKVEQSQCGGSGRIMISLDSLSDKAKAKYKAKDAADARRVFDEMESQESSEEPWYVGVDIGWYMKKYKDTFYKMVDFSKQIERYLEYKGSDKTEYTEETAKRLGMSGRNFRRKVDSYREGMRTAIEMNEYDGKNYDYYKVLALCPAPRDRKGFVLTDDMKTLLENLWSDKKFQANQQFDTAIYDAFVKLSEEREWEPIPSYPTVNRYLNFLKGKYADAQYYMRFGPREFKRKKMMKRLRNIGSLKVMELVQGDGHTFDAWVKITRENGSITAIKPVLVALIDVRSRCIVGWAICEMPNAQVIKRMIYHMIYPRKNTPICGVPRVLLIDNGKDWTAQTLTGRPRTERFEIDEETKGFYKSIGIEDDMRSLPYQAWSKAQIERYFGTLCKMFTNRLDSYVGTLTGSQTNRKIKKDIKGMLEKDELLTIEEFSEAFEQFLNDTYHKRVHSGLKSQKEKSPIPIDVFLNAERYFKAAPPEEYTKMQLLECKERTVTGIGIKAFGRHYQHQGLAEYIDQKVEIRYNPGDLETIFVYKKDGTKICEVKNYIGLDPIAADDDTELMEHIRDQKRQIRKVKEKINSLRETPEEREKRKSERTVLVPELSGEKQKVIGLPDDKKYRQEVKTRKSQNESNEFFDKQAEKALARLAKIGG